MYNYIQTVNLVLNCGFFISLLVFERSLFRTPRHHGEGLLMEKIAVLYKLTIPRETPHTTPVGSK